MNRSVDSLIEMVTGNKVTDQSDEFLEELEKQAAEEQANLSKAPELKEVMEKMSVNEIIALYNKASETQPEKKAEEKKADENKKENTVDINDVLATLKNKVVATKTASEEDELEAMLQSISAQDLIDYLNEDTEKTASDEDVDLTQISAADFLDAIDELENEEKTASVDESELEEWVQNHSAQELIDLLSDTEKTASDEEVDLTQISAADFLDALDEIEKDAGMVGEFGKTIADGARAAGAYVGKHKKAFGIGAGGVGIATTGALSYKSILDKVRGKKLSTIKTAEEEIDLTQISAADFLDAMDEIEKEAGAKTEKVKDAARGAYAYLKGPMTRKGMEAAGVQSRGVRKELAKSYAAKGVAAGAVGAGGLGARKLLKNKDKE
jgi:hypothetical protein